MSFDEVQESFDGIVLQLFFKPDSVISGVFSGVPDEFPGSVVSGSLFPPGIVTM